MQTKLNEIQFSVAIFNQRKQNGRQPVKRNIVTPSKRLLIRTVCTATRPPSSRPHTLGQHAAAAALEQCKTVRHVWCRNPSTEIDLRHSQPGQLRLLAIFGSWLAAAVSLFPHTPPHSICLCLSLSAVAIYLQIFFSIKNMYAPLAPALPALYAFACRCNCAAVVSFYSSSSSPLPIPPLLRLFFDYLHFCLSLNFDFRRLPNYITHTPRCRNFHKI